MDKMLFIFVATLACVAAQPTSYRTCGADEKDSDCMMEFMSLKMSQLAILQENIRHDQSRQHQEEMVLVQGIRGDVSQEASELQAIRAEIVQATSQLRTTRDELSQARNDVSEATSLLENLQNDISQATTRLDSTREQLSQATSRLETVRDDVSQQTDLLENIRGELSEHRSQSQSQVTLLENIRREQSEHRSQWQSQSTLLENIRSELSEHRSQSQSQATLLENIRSELSEHQSQSQSQVTLLENIRRELSEHQSQSADLLETMSRNQSEQQPEMIVLLNAIKTLVSPESQVVPSPLPSSAKPKHCKDVQNLGNSDNGVYAIYPTLEYKSLNVYCDMETDGGGWTVFQRRQDGSVNFERSWAEYRDGFGNLAGEHWLGNQYIHALTAASAQEMRIELGSWENERVYARYGQFSVGSEADGFRLNVGDYSGTAGGDSLAYGQNGMKFSTMDRDNDKWSGNCASKYSCGFWFNKCGTADLNHPYRPSSTVSSGWRGIIWNDYKGPSYSLKYTEMKLRPV